VSEALTTARSYKQASPVDGSRAVIRHHSGNPSDPERAAAFLRRWDAVREIHRRLRDDPAPLDADAR